MLASRVKLFLIDLLIFLSGELGCIYSFHCLTGTWLYSYVLVLNFVLLVSNNCFPQDEGTSSCEMVNTECSETSSEVSGSERTRPEHSKKASSVLGKKISIRKKVI